MSRLLSAEFYKLWKSVGFRVCYIVFAGRDILYLLLVRFLGNVIGVQFDGLTQFEYLLISFSGSSVSGMLFGFVAASLITSDYKSRDMQCAIAQGHSRGHILISKIIVYVVAVWILAAEDVLIYLVGGSIIGGFGKPFTASVLGYMLRAVLCEGFVMTMLYMTCVFIAFAFTSKAASVSLNILVFFVLNMGLGIVSMIAKSDKLDDILTYLPLDSVKEMGARDIDWSHAGISLAVAAVYGAVMISASWLMFRKRDLR